MNGQKEFSFAGTTVGEVPARHLRRESDPQTSHDGAERVERTASTVKERILSFASATVPYTANELAAMVVKEYGGNQESCRKRAMELARADDGRLKAVGTKTCEITGAEATAFFLSGE